MRYRILLLFIFASLLGTPVLMNHSRMQRACANIPDPATCAAVFPTPFWVLPLGLVSLAVLAYAGYLLASAWAERHHEKEMLDSVGVHVPEEDLPLEE